VAGFEEVCRIGTQSRLVGRFPGDYGWITGKPDVNLYRTFRSIGLSWKSDPLNTSKCDFAIIGEEVNGRYYDVEQTKKE